ncbi:hypothetical protein BC938DRAFT_475125, partial [Jimgerdemannia flammicorona]
MNEGVEKRRIPRECQRSDCLKSECHTSLHSLHVPNSRWHGSAFIVRISNRAALLWLEDAISSSLRSPLFRFATEILVTSCT